MSLKLLHISDLHLRPRDYDQDVVIRSFEAQLPNVKDLQKPNIVVFSGDLNQAGGNKQEFEASLDIIAHRFMQPLGLDLDALVICPGNHDVDRDLVRSENWVETGLRASLQTRSQINEFVEQTIHLDIRNGQIPTPFARLDGFYNGVWNRVAQDEDQLSLFHLLQKRTVGDLKIGFCSFNTAWRCTGEANNLDRNDLILGERVIDLAVDQMSDCDVKVAVFHHPTDWLIDDDRAAVESRLHLNFDILMYGHVHSSKPHIVYSGSGGAIYAQSGCLYQNRDYFNGYSVVNYSIQAESVEFEAFEYDDRSRSFNPAVGLFPPHGKNQFELALSNSDPAIKLGKLVAISRPSIRKLGNEHVSLAAQDAAKVDIERQFVCPPIRRFTHNPAYLDTDVEPGETHSTVENELKTSKNLVILGSSEGGKTSIGHFCALNTAMGGADKLRLPVMGKFADLKRGSNILWRLVRAYANEVSDGKITRDIVETLPILVIIDDADLSDNDRLQIMSELQEQHDDLRLVVLANDTRDSTLAVRQNSVPLEDVECFQIMDLPRNSIRVLSANWLNSEPEAPLTDTMYEQVMEHIQRSGLPRSGYVVSLILWTLRNKSAGEILNEAVLLQNIVDHLLGKMDYKGALRREFDFTSKSAVLQDLSVWFKETDDVQNKNDVLQHIIQYLEKKGLSYDASRILDGFIDCGILQKIDDEISFRYNRFQEFFVAGQLREYRSQLDEILNGDNWLFYARELDIYTSRFRHDSFLLDVAKQKLTDSVGPLSQLSDRELHNYLGQRGIPELALKRLRKMRSEPMSAKRIDDLKDKAEQSLQKRTDQARESRANDSHEASKGPKSLRHLTTLTLYSQFIRNLEFADRPVKKAHLSNCLKGWLEIMKNILESAKGMFEELKQEIEKENKGEDDSKKLREIIGMLESIAKNFIPTFLSSQVYQSLGSEKLSDLLAEISDDEKEDVLLRLLSVFVLMEVDPAKAISSLYSPSWKDDLSKRWVNLTIEARLSHYYSEHYISSELNGAFEAIIAEVEQRLSNGSKQGKGLTIQRLARGNLAKGRPKTK